MIFGCSCSLTCLSYSSIAAAIAFEDPFVKSFIVVKAANLILGEEFLPTPEKKTQVQLMLFSA